MTEARRQAALEGLIAEVGRYLSGFDHSGIDDVRNGIDRWGKGHAAARAPSRVPACRHLDSALAAIDVASLVNAIDRATPHLQWITYESYPPAEIGQPFIANHAFTSLIGEAAPFKAVDFDLGLFLISPGILYRDHHHAAPELYAPLTGPHGWRFRPGDRLDWRPAHTPVWNEPWQPHATMVGKTPFLCIYAWTKDVHDPAKVIAAEDWAQLETVD